MIANWFLPAAPGNQIVGRWADLAAAYWSRRDTHGDYFWAHVLFTDFYGWDPAVRSSWDRVPHLSGRQPHHFTPYPEGLLRPLVDDDLPWVDGRRHLCSSSPTGWGSARHPPVRCWHTSARRPWACAAPARSPAGSIGGADGCSAQHLTQPTPSR